MKVLSVDDNPENLYLLEQQLAPLGWTVVSARNGAEALELLQREPFDVIVSDILMPHMDGFQLCHEVKQRPALRHIPVVFYTATYTDPKDEETGLSMGAARFLVKPSDPDDLVRAVTEVVVGGATPTPPTPPTTLEHEAVLLKAYNERLVQKLDRKVAQLEVTTRDLREVFDNTSDAILLLGVREDRLVCEALNRCACDVLGARGDGAAPRSLEEVVGPSVLAPLSQHARRCVATGEPTSYVQRLGAGEAERVLDVRLSPVRDAAGRVYRVTVVARDMTEPLRASAARDALFERLQEAVKAGQVGLWEWDLRTDEVRFAPEWKRQLGHDEHEVADAFDEWERRLHPDDRDRALARLRAFVASDDAGFEAEFRLRHKDGSYRWILSRASEVRDAAGRRVRLLGSHVDVTERMTLQTQLLQVQKMESVGRMAAGVAHDFNNLLTPILGFAELSLATLAAEDPLRSNLEQIQRAASRAAALARRLLVFSRRDAPRPGTLDLNGVVLDLRRLLERVVGDDVALEVATGPAPAWVRADAGQVEQVIMNLVVNARDAMPRGGRLRLETSEVELPEGASDAHGAARPGRYVVLAVTDTGVGMTPDVLSRMFEPFFTTKEPGRGTGLGLSTVWAILQGVQGFVAASSTPGQGSTFRACFPAAAPPGQADDAAPAPPARSRGAETILLVDDDEAVRRVALHILESGGYEVIAAPDGESALTMACAAGARVSLLVTDLVLPNMSGCDLAERLSRERAGLKVLFASGAADGDAQAAAGDTLTKPFTPLALLRKVREVLDA